MGRDVNGKRCGDATMARVERKQQEYRLRWSEIRNCESSGKACNSWGEERPRERNFGPKERGEVRPKKRGFKLRVPRMC